MTEDLQTLTFDDIPVQQVLDGARDASLQHVFVVGQRADGALYLFSSRGDTDEDAHILDKARRSLMDWAVSLIPK